jgi:hypothetical protein
MSDDVRINPTALAAYINSPSGDVAKDLTKRGIRVEREAKRLAHQAGTGRTYHKSNPKRTHRASAPGQPFATDLGTAAASITHAIGVDAVGIFCQVGSGLKKMRWLEFGTRLMAPRPTLRRALRKAGR